VIDGKLLKKRAHIQKLDPEKLHDLTDEEAYDLLHTWKLWARPNQLEPDAILPSGEHWTTWLILAGRGFGKTRCGAETVIKWARSGQCKRIALVAEDSADARDVMVEGESGILACSPRDFMPKYEPSKRRLTWPNGAQATLFLRRGLRLSSWTPVRWGLVR
jgi:phage terminase large subunit-like protein